jgi:PAS domain S-box-containing protein
MTTSYLIRFIRENRRSIARGAEQTLGETIPGSSDDLPLPVLVDTLLGCIVSVLQSGRRLPPRCSGRLSWDLPEVPSLRTSHQIMVTVKKEIVQALEEKLEDDPQQLVTAICELEDSLDVVLGFLLGEQAPVEENDLLRLGEILSRQYDEDIICIYDIEGKLVFISPSVTGILGYTEEEWKREGPHLMIKNPVYEVLESGSNGESALDNIRYMVVIPHRSGAEKVIEVEEKFVHDAEGGILGLWSRMHDVSARENLRRELRSTSRKYEELFEEAADIIFTLDPGGRLDSVNRRFRELTGYTSEYLRGKSLEELVHDQDRELCRSRLEQLKSGMVVEFEARIYSSSGKDFISAFRCNPVLRDGVVDSFIGIARDVTRQKQLENDLKSKMELLDRFRKVSSERELRIQELLRQIEGAYEGEMSD